MLLETLVASDDAGNLHLIQCWRPLLAHFETAARGDADSACTWCLANGMPLQRVDEAHFRSVDGDMRLHVRPRNRSAH